MMAKLHDCSRIHALITGPPGMFAYEIRYFLSNAKAAQSLMSISGPINFQNLAYPS